MPALGVPELLIILVIVVVLFGAGRLAGIGSAFGNSVRDFRKSVRDDDAPRTDPDATRGTSKRPDLRKDGEPGPYGT